MIKPDFKNINFNNITPLAGTIGCLVVGIGLLASATHYTSPEGYSPINHFISELGLAKNSSMADVFNHSLMTGGILLMFFSIGLGNFIGKGNLAKFATITGMISTLSFSAIGYYTAETWIAHIVAASVFFAGAMITIVLFSISIWKNRQSGLHPFLSIQGMFIAALYFVALIWPKELLLQSVTDTENFVRPAIWILSILEWSYCLMICFWIIMVSANLVYITRKMPATDKAAAHKVHSPQQ